LEIRHFAELFNGKKDKIKSQEISVLSWEHKNIF